MRQYSLIIILSLFACSAKAQYYSLDSLQKIINNNKGDTAEVNARLLLSLNSAFFTGEVNNAKLTEGLNIAKRALLLSEKIKDKKGEANSNLVIGSLLGSMSNTAQSLSHTALSIQHGLRALNLYENAGDATGMAQAHLLLQANYREAEDYANALMHEFEGTRISEQYHVIGVLDFNGHRLAPLFLAETAQTYILMNQPNAALAYARKSIEENELFDGTPWEFPIYLLATIQQMQGAYVQALQNYRRALSLTRIQKDTEQDTIQIYSGMSTLFRKTGQFDSSIYYGAIVNKSWRPEISETKNLLEALNNLYQVYKLKGENDSTLKYLELIDRLRESFFNTEKEKQIQQITFGAQLKQQELITNEANYKNRVQAFIFTAGILALLVISGLLIRNNRQKQKGKIKIESAYAELKSTQQQLIQSEKMASLGELTAGIAHEIQNPLNFVNNFSETNRELLDEAEAEFKAGNQAEGHSLLRDIKANEEKVNLHGKRADAIVKNMLEHSRSAKGEKQATDLNALVDEYLRLAYHGFRGKDKNFNATIQTHFDEHIGKIEVVPQEIGRVLLNLFNNSFYAVNVKKKKGSVDYEPKVEVSTKRLNDKIDILVKDNGMGISKSLVVKIFQPFFTTKPTGEGTGLGLSLSYDIVKAHSGELSVESKEGEGATFLIWLPL